MKLLILFIGCFGALFAKVSNGVYTDDYNYFQFKIPSGFEIVEESCEKKSSYILLTDNSYDRIMVEAVAFKFPGGSREEFLKYAAHSRLNDLNHQGKIEIVRMEPIQEAYFILYRVPNLMSSPVSDLIGEYLSLVNGRVFIVSYNMSNETLFTLRHLGHEKEAIEKLYWQMLKTIAKNVTVMNEDNKTPTLYKIISIEKWKESDGKDFIVLDDTDKDFIHFSTEEQLPRILEKFWKNKDYIVLKIDPRKLPGRLEFEPNPGGSGQKYYHLYEGLIPKDAILE